MMDEMICLLTSGISLNQTLRTSLLNSARKLYRGDIAVKGRNKKSIDIRRDKYFMRVSSELVKIKSGLERKRSSLDFFCGLVFFATIEHELEGLSQRGNVRFIIRESVLMMPEDFEDDDFYAARVTYNELRAMNAQNN